MSGMRGLAEARRAVPCPGGCGTWDSAPAKGGNPPIINLQRTAGNRAVRRLLSDAGMRDTVDGRLPLPFPEEDAGAEPGVTAPMGRTLPYREAVEAVDRARFFRNSPIVRVQAQIPATTLDHTKTAREISLLARSASGRRSSADNAGLTRARRTMQMRLATEGGTATGGRMPFWITDLEVTPRYRSVTVYIAREYAAASCEYRVTLAHENEHVRADTELLEAYAGRMRAALVFADIPTEQNPLSVASEEEGKRAVGTRLRAILTPVYAELRQRLHAANSALDTPANYSLVHAQCSNW
jgi:hypothetical protein